MCLMALCAYLPASHLLMQIAYLSRGRGRISCDIFLHAVFLLQTLWRQTDTIADRCPRPASRGEGRETAKSPTPQTPLLPPRAQLAPAAAVVEPTLLQWSSNGRGSMRRSDAEQTRSPICICGPSGARTLWATKGCDRRTNQIGRGR